MMGLLCLCLLLVKKSSIPLKSPFFVCVRTLSTLIRVGVVVFALAFLFALNLVWSAFAIFFLSSFLCCSRSYCSAVLFIITYVFRERWVLHLWLEGISWFEWMISISRNKMFLLYSLDFGSVCVFFFFFFPVFAFFLYRSPVFALAAHKHCLSFHYHYLNSK